MDAYDELSDNDEEYWIDAFTFGVIRTRHKRVGEITVNPWECMLVCTERGAENMLYYNMWLTKPHYGFASPHPKEFRFWEEAKVHHLKVI